MRAIQSAPDCLSQGVTMRIRGSILALAVLLSTVGPGVKAQQSDPTQFDKTFQSNLAKAQEACKALWSDRAFDGLRAKIPLGEEKPTFEMLKNAEKLSVKDRPLADLAIRALEKCRAAYSDVYAVLPPQVSAMIHGVERRQDALVADLYRGKLSLGEFNTSMSRMTGEFALALSGVQTAQPNPPPPGPDVGTAAKAAPQPETKRKEADSTTIYHETRLALVLGNSGYINLPKLSNPVNDARAVADILGKMGYQTRLLLDASEQKIRREVRQFASDSTKADVALVYYAGHGAQVNGNNYLLPTDIEIPRTEADIQFAGLKVDDLVNSIASNTKILFLDACRDNPLLFKNLVKGRGSSPAGLAPASISNFEQKPGGGVFIAYATDAGSVADDGNGSHSPFTQALLRNMQKPISIDDMFSFVTKEVRLVTKNAQRPYKYASLENIVCIAPNCSSSAVAIKSDIFQQAIQSEADELKIALQTNNSDALETFLQKYPDTSKRLEVLEAIANLKRSQFTEWTLYEIGDQHLPQYLQISSIKRIGDRAVARTKSLFDPTKPKTYRGKTFPDAVYQEQILVYDCTSPMMASTEDFIFNGTGELLFHYKWGDPKYLNIAAIGFAIQTGSVAYSGRTIACDGTLATPLVSKRQMATMNFSSLSSTLDGNGEILYGSAQKSRSDPNQMEVVTVFRNFSDHNAKELFPAGTSIPDPPNFRQEADLILIRCDVNEFLITRTELWDASNQLVRMSFLPLATNTKYNNSQPTSPFAALQAIVCPKSEAGLGVRLAQDQGSIVVTEVIDGSPAAKAGVAVNDIIFQIDNEPVVALTLQKVVEKLRGPEGTQVLIKILRSGSVEIERSITRGIVKLQSAEGARK
jgi:hypothetical protein